MTLGWDPLGRLYSQSSWYQPRTAYDGENPIVDYASDGSLFGRYVFGADGEPLTMSILGNRSFYHLDERGSAIATTNDSGTPIRWDGYPQAVNTYDEYGNNPGKQADTAFQYTGQRWLAGIAYGIYHYRARMYHAGLGRFLQTDPVGYGTA